MFLSRTLKVRQLSEGAGGIIRTVITGDARCFSAGPRAADRAIGAAVSGDGDVPEFPQPDVNAAGDQVPEMSVRLAPCWA